MPPMQRPKEVTSGILFLAAGGLWLAVAIRQIGRHNDLWWLSMSSALLFIVAGATRFWAWTHPRKQPAEATVPTEPRAS